MMRVSIAELGWVVNPSFGRKVLALLAAHFDTSYNRDDPPALRVIAGYVAPLDEWARIELEWHKELVYWKLDSFHLRDLKDRLSAEMAIASEAHFCEIINKSQLYAIGAALMIDEWQRPDWGHDRTIRLSGHYEQALTFAFESVGAYTKEIFPSEDVAIICCFDETEKRVEDAHERVQRQYPNLITATVSRAVPKIIPLQCADLGAGTLRRSWHSIGKNRPVAQNIAWGEMPKGAGGRIGFWPPGGALKRALQIYDKQLGGLKWS